MAIGGAALVALLLTACTAPVPDESPTPADVTTPTPDAGGSTADPAEVAAIQAAVETTMEESNVRAAIVRVMRGDEVVLTQAWGESMAQVPATTDMHFRSGAVSIPMVSTVLLQLVDEGTVALDDKLSEWMPDVPNADKVTLEQLSQMTSGYADYVQDPTFLDDFNRDPFRQWTPEELYTFGTSKPLFFEPGTNWGYAHTNYVLLALALEKITGQSMIDLIQERIFDPLGMEQTADPGTPEILSPVLHAFDSERREYLQVADGLPYIEDSTYWNPSWSLGPGLDPEHRHHRHGNRDPGDRPGRDGERGVVREDDRADPARQDDEARCLPQHVLRAERVLHVWAGHRAVRGLAAAESAVPRVRRRHGVSARGGRHDRDRRDLRRRCVRPADGSAGQREHRQSRCSPPSRRVVAPDASTPGT